jgi:hypothetical protein
MKWISLITGMLLLTSTAHSQDSSEFLHTPEFTDLLEEANAPQRSSLTPGNVTLSAYERAELQRTPENARLRLPSLDEVTGNKEDSLIYQRIELFAPGASIRLISPTGIRLIKPGRRIFYLATNETTGIGLAVDPDSGNITGFASKGGEKLEISGTDKTQLKLVAVEPLPDGSDFCGTRIEDQQDFDLTKALGGTARSLSAVTAGSGITYQAEVAIDTDNEWMAGKGNDESTAMNFITDLFLAMNVFYERDMETRLLVSSVTLRTATDPYTVPTGPSAQLDEFAEYWRINQGSVERDFAAMFSGRDIHPYYFSGIAWLDQYCREGSVWGSRTVGSYSFNAIGSNRTPANTAILVGHELGHNMGSPHTHCYDTPIDQCYSGESSGCYTGEVSCPAGGKGTIMSYCHVSAAGCGNSNSQFHSGVQDLIKNRLAANTPSCIALYEEEPPSETPIFKDGFE